MAAPSMKDTSSNAPRIGDVHAAQPLSGNSSVETSRAVHGLGHGGFVRIERSTKGSNAA